MIKTDTERWSGRFVLMLAHVAGMIDLVALPVWVGAALIGQYHLSPPLAGAMVTAYLAAAVVASLIFAPRFHRHAAHRAAPLGYLVATVAFVILTQTADLTAMFALHAIAGFGAGTGLSFTHGTIGRSLQPHRLFAIIGIGLGVSGIFFLGIAQDMVPKHGGALIFALFAGLMAVATLSTSLAFPRPAAPSQTAHNSADTEPVAQHIPAMVWWAVTGLTLMAVTQSMVFSFVERIGAERGFGERVLGVLIALGFMNLFAPAVAAVLERRLKPLRVAQAGAITQATLAIVLAFSVGFMPYAAAGATFVSVMIFTHTFVFGWLSRHDTSGRAVALTPAVLMSGAAIGPVVGGFIMAGSGATGLGMSALAVGLLSLGCYSLALTRFRTHSLSSAQA